MRLFNCLLFLFTFLIISCQSNQTDDGIEEDDKLSIDIHNEVENDFFEKLNPDDIDNVYVSDLDHDSIPDTFYVIAPKLLESDMMIEEECDGPCITSLFFGNKLPTLMIDQSIGGNVTVLDDINGNGFRELVFFPHWFQSCWSRMDIFSFNGTEWTLVKSIDYNSCEESIQTRFETVEPGLLRVYTNGEKIEDIVLEEGESDSDYSGIEEKIYDVRIP